MHRRVTRARARPLVLLVRVRDRVALYIRMLLGVRNETASNALRSWINGALSIRINQMLGTIVFRVAI